MRKDYIQATAPADHETEFVEKYWTAVWEREGGPQGQIDLIPSREEYRAMSSYLAKLPQGARILDGGCGPAGLLGGGSRSQPRNDRAAAGALS